MIGNLKIVVVLPSFNAARTLEATYREIPLDMVDEVVLVDDGSNDETIAVARKLNIRHILVHPENRGYGGNQKTCFDTALALGADVVVLLHPDYQYSPKLIGAMCYMLHSGIYDVVLASRILGGGALKGGMPLYKYFFNRVLTLFENVFLNQKISEYHTGYRAYKAEALHKVLYHLNSDGFIFDNQILSQLIMKRFAIGEISCPAKYFPEASSIKMKAAIVYGFGIIGVVCAHLLHRVGLKRHQRYN
ncbi:MAG: glycosyltransferase family 2 protein [Chitinophagaceae bacterium]|nr:MAG: glycosyltransferase family 2 protein [Chitinophagaceae bacterium]